MIKLIKNLVFFFCKGNASFVTEQNQTQELYKSQSSIDKLYEEFEHRRFIGINFDQQTRLYKVRYRNNNKDIFVGRFKTLEEAKKEYIRYTLLNNLRMKFYR